MKIGAKKADASKYIVVETSDVPRGRVRNWVIVHTVLGTYTNTTTEETKNETARFEPKPCLNAILRLPIINQ